MGESADFYVLLFGVVYAMRFLTADQNKQHVNVCEELHQIASDNAVLFRVIIGVESSI
jgi:hypothetical protein